MCTGRREWDTEILENLFNDSDKEYIKGIQLNEARHKDQIYWCKEN